MAKKSRFKNSISTTVLCHFLLSYTSKNCLKLSFWTSSLFIVLKVSKSQKQIMASWILPKNERNSLSWTPSVLRIVSSVRFLEESRTPYFFSRFTDLLSGPIKKLFPFLLIKIGDYFFCEKMSWTQYCSKVQFF